MTNPLLANNSLKKFIDDSSISQDKKRLLLSKVEQMDDEERKGLLETLIDIVVLDIEEKEAVKRIKKYWHTPPVQAQA